MYKRPAKSRRTRQTLSAEQLLTQTRNDMAAKMAEKIHRKEHQIEMGTWFIHDHIQAQAAILRKKENSPMLLKIFSVHDSKAAAFLPPFFMTTEGQATRAFANALMDSTHQFGMNPADYTLYSVGVWDDETGKFEPEAPTSITNGLTLQASMTAGRAEANVEPEISDGPPIQPGPISPDPSELVQ